MGEKVVKMIGAEVRKITGRGEGEIMREDIIGNDRKI